MSITLNSWGKDSSRFSRPRWRSRMSDSRPLPKVSRTLLASSTAFSVPPGAACSCARTNASMLPSASPAGCAELPVPCRGCKGCLGDCMG